MDARADIYAVGVLGYEMLSGQPPFTGQHAPGDPRLAGHPSTPAARPSYRPMPPPELAGTIMRCSGEGARISAGPSAEELLSRLEQLWR